MGMYIFKHPTEEKYVEVFQRMNDEHIYEENGIKWFREYTIPQTQVDSSIDPFSQKDFLEKTKGKNYNLGQLWDKSAEMSQKRQQKAGVDQIKEKTIKDYEKKTRKNHPLKEKPTKFEI